VGQGSAVDDNCECKSLQPQINGTYPDSDGATLSRLLSSEGVRLTEVGTPVTTPNRKDRKFGNDDSSTDGRGDFLGGLDSQTDVATAVTDDNDCLEPSALTGTGLLLDGLDL